MLPSMCLRETLSVLSFARIFEYASKLKSQERLFCMPCTGLHLVAAFYTIAA